MNLLVKVSILKIVLLLVFLLCAKLCSAQLTGKYPDVVKTVYVQKNEVVVVVKESFRDWRKVPVKIKQSGKTKFTLVVNSLQYDCIYWNKKNRHYIKIDGQTFEIDPYAMPLKSI